MNKLNAIKPTSLDDFAYSDPCTRQTLEILVQEPSLMPAEKMGILLYGDYGTGKTALAKALPALFNDSRPKTNLFQFQGGSHDFISCQHTFYREQLNLIKSVRTRHWCRNSCELHFVILDEIDNYKKEVQKDLKGIMTDSVDTVFILTTNHIKDVEAGIQNRCIVLNQSLAADDEWMRVMHRWALKDGYQMHDDEQKNILSSVASRSARDVSTAYKMYIRARPAIELSTRAATA